MSCDVAATSGRSRSRTVKLLMHGSEFGSLTNRHYHEISAGGKISSHGLLVEVTQLDNLPR